MRARWHILAMAVSIILALPPAVQAQYERPETPPGGRPTTTYGRTTMDDSEEDFDRSRFYLGVGPLWAVENFGRDNASAVIGGQRTELDADNSPGAEARAGYRFHPNLAVEMLGQFYGDMDVHATSPTTGQRTDIGDIESASGTVNLKVLALRGRVQPYVVGGVGAMWLKPTNLAPNTHIVSQHWAFAGRVGIGVDFYVDENFAVDVEGAYLMPTGPLDEFTLTAVT